MTLTSIIALFGALLVLALIPGPAVFAITSRAMTGGLRPACIMLLGILTADYIFIFMSMAGLLALAQVMGGLFVIIKYLGAAYLFYLAISIWRAPVNQQPDAPSSNQPGSDYVSGLLITLGNPKAILFYVGFFPAFLDMNAITYIDVIIIIAVTAVALGGVTFSYAFLASKAGQWLRQSRLRKRFNYLAGTVMAGSGVALVLKD